MRALAARLVLTLALALLAPLTLAPGCGLRTIILDLPLDGALVDDSFVLGEARVGNGFDLASVEVRVDGVDLVDALGLTPPFADASGVVLIGGDPIAVSGFDFPISPNPRLVRVTLAGLPVGAHVLEVEGTKTAGGVVTRTAGFDIVGAFTQEAHVLGAGGRPLGPESAGSEGTLFGATLGQPLAAPPVALSGGGELRSGFVEAAEARIAGGTP